MTEMVSMVELKIPTVDKSVGKGRGEAHSSSVEGGKGGWRAFLEGHVARSFTFLIHLKLYILTNHSSMKLSYRILKQVLGRYLFKDALCSIV